MDLQKETNDTIMGRKIKISIRLEELLNKQKLSEYEDEKINSNFYLISLPTALRKLKSMEGSKDYDEKKMKNEWLSEICPMSRKISAISFDQLKMKIKPDSCSCDGFLYHAGEQTDKLSILFEMKNINRSDMVSMLLSKKDSILDKVRDSVVLLRDEIDFSGAFTGQELVEHTHLLLIYGGKADSVSEASLGIGKKQIVKKDANGRQVKAARLPVKDQHKYESKKGEKELFQRFSDELRGRGLASCKKGYFGIPVKDPKWEKQSGQKMLSFTMLSKEDLRKVIEDIRFFENWDWGVYRTYMQQ